MLLDEHRTHQEHMQHFYLRADGDGALYHLNMGNHTHPALAPHTRVRVEYAALESSQYGKTLHVKAPINVLAGTGRALAGLDGISFTKRPRILFFIMDFCGKGGGPAATQQVRVFWGSQLKTPAVTATQSKQGQKLHLTSCLPAPGRQ